MMKKFVSAFLAIILLICSFETALAAGGYAEYLVTEPGGAVIYYADSLSSTILTVAPKDTILTATASSGDFVKVMYDGYRGWTDVGKLQKYPSSDDNIKSIEIISEPDKTVYFEDEKPDTAGLMVAAVTEDGTKQKITGYTLMLPDMSESGEKTVTVSWNGFTAGFEITVKPASIDKIAITNYPDKLVYRQGDELDTTGLVVTAYYSDGNEPKEIENYTVSGFDSFILGEQEITITYKDVSVKFIVNITERTVLSVEIDAEPEKTVYYGTDFKIDLTGLEFTALYDNGTRETVTPERAYCKRAVAIGSNTVILEYKGCTASFPIEVKAKLSECIEVVAPTKTKYNIGEEEDFSGLIVYLKYNDGSKIAIDDYTVESKLDTKKTGDYVVTVRYKTYEAKFTLTVEYTAILGDANLDSRVTAADARLVLRFAAGIDAWSSGIDNCDVNFDGDVRADDARLILRFAADLIKEF